MNASEIKDQLEAEPFEPFIVVTSSGDRYEVRHREFALLARRGHLYVFRPVEDSDAQVDKPTIISLLHIVAIEPAPERAA